jgi:hypothetical protein
MKVCLGPGLHLVGGLRRAIGLEARRCDLAADILQAFVSEAIASELLARSLGKELDDRPNLLGSAPFEAGSETFEDESERVCVARLNILKSHNYSPLSAPLTNASGGLTRGYMDGITSRKIAVEEPLASGSVRQHTASGGP